MAEDWMPLGILLALLFIGTYYIFCAKSRNERSPNSENISLEINRAEIATQKRMKGTNILPVHQLSPSISAFKSKYGITDFDVITISFEEVCYSINDKAAYALLKCFK